MSLGDHAGSCDASDFGETLKGLMHATIPAIAHLSCEQSHSMNVFMA